MENTKLLSELSELRNEVKNNFLVEKLQQQGLSQSLNKLYEPLLKSNKSNKDDLIKHISDISNKYNTNLLEFKATFSNFPDLVRNIENIKDKLDINASDIINEITTTKQINDSILNRISNLDENFQGLNSLITKPEQYPKMFDTPTTKGDKTQIDEIVKKYATPSSDSGIATERLAEKVESHFTGTESIIDTLRNSKAEEYKKLLTDTNKQQILNYVSIYSPNFTELPFTRIKTEDPEFYLELIKARNETNKQKTKFGKGIKIVSSKDDLLKELQRLMGSYKSGNTAVFNELESVIDALRRSGNITLSQSKKLYKELK